jgi:hypothetical protein
MYLIVLVLVVSFSVFLLFVVSDFSNLSAATKQKMKALKLEQSDTTNSNKAENETTKTRTIRKNEQQLNRE